MRQIEEQIDTSLLDGWWSRRSINCISKRLDRKDRRPMYSAAAGRRASDPLRSQGFRVRENCVSLLGYCRPLTLVFELFSIHSCQSCKVHICWIQTYGQLWRKSLCIRWQITFFNQLRLNASIVWRYSGPVARVTIFNAILNFPSFMCSRCRVAWAFRTCRWCTARFTDINGAVCITDAK